MEEELINFLSQHNCTYIKIGSESELIKIYNLLVLNQFEEATTEIEYLYFGLHYSILSKVNDSKNDDKNDTNTESFEHYKNLCKKYYFKAANENNSIAMCNLVTIYLQDNDIDNAIKYCLMAIELNDMIAMFLLGNIYYNHQDYENSIKYHLMFVEHNIAYEKQKNIDNERKYYLMRIEDHFIDAMNSLSSAYDKQKDIESAKKYCLIAIEYNSVYAMRNLAVLYEKGKDVENAIKYYLMAIEHGSVEAMRSLAVLYYQRNKKQEGIKYYIMAVEHGDDSQWMLKELLKELFNNNEHISNELLELIYNTPIFDSDDTPNYLKLLRSTYRTKIDQIELHFKYQPGAEGMWEAKKNFIKRINNESTDDD